MFNADSAERQRDPCTFRKENGKMDFFFNGDT